MGGNIIMAKGMGEVVTKLKIAVIAVLAWTAVATFVILQVVKLIVGLRVDEQQETQGLDITQHEETGYNM